MIVCPNCSQLSPCECVCVQWMYSCRSECIYVAIWAHVFFAPCGAAEEWLCNRRRSGSARPNSHFILGFFFFFTRNPHIQMVSGCTQLINSQHVVGPAHRTRIFNFWSVLEKRCDIPLILIIGCQRKVKNWLKYNQQKLLSDIIS